MKSVEELEGFEAHHEEKGSSVEERVRKPYEPPQILRKRSLRRVVLLTGGEESVSPLE
ncbi:MAG: hypothetical protein NZM37_10620 [Sandaracinaceae bacterium]|nr:hypothetical protein [Sandaracinaceae bacterium]